MINYPLDIFQNDKSRVIQIFLLSLVARLLAWPFSDVTEADATSRLQLAEFALNNGGALVSMQWPSGHIYFLAFGHLLSAGGVSGPVLLTLLMGAASVIPFYLFTRNTFNRDGALYACLLFSFSPLVFRSSLTTLAECYHLFFCMMTLWGVSEFLIRTDRRMRWIVMSAVMATIACGGRFEAWVFSALVSMILLIKMEWRAFIVFAVVSSLYPVYWMIYCYLEAGSPFVSLEMVQHQNYVIGMVNHGLSSEEMLRRTIYFPFSWFVSVFPLTALIILALIPIIIMRGITRPLQLMLVLLFLFFMAFFIIESRNGSLADQHRYSVTLIMLSLPIYAVLFQSSRFRRAKVVTSVLLISILIPWSYCWQYVSWHRVFSFSSVMESEVAYIVANTYTETESIPQIRPAEVKEVSRHINNNWEKGQGYYVDFWDWNPCYYLIQQAPAGANVMLSHGMTSEEINSSRYVEYLTRFPTGWFVLFQYSTMASEATVTGNLFQIKGIPGAMQLNPVLREGHIYLFKYEYKAERDLAAALEQAKVMTPVFVFRKDEDYYRNRIREDRYYAAGMWREALRRRRSIDEQWTIEAKKVMREERGY